MNMIRPPMPKQYVGLPDPVEPSEVRWDEDAQVTVITPTIKGRAAMLERAKRSVAAQTAPVKHRIMLDVEGEGPSVMRNRAIEEADTEWVAFLDDDDELYPEHCEALLTHATLTGADLVYPWFDLNVLGNIRNDSNPLRVGSPDESNLVDPMGEPVTPVLLAQLAHRNWIPVTLLVRRGAMLAVDGFPQVNSERWPHSDCEDWACWRDLNAAGFMFAHLPMRTWVWHHHGMNTSGRADRAHQMGLR